MSVALVARDIDDAPVKGAEVKAFSEDWGLAFPEYWFGRTDDSGALTLEIPAGNWSFFIGGGRSYSEMHKGQGYLAVLKGVCVEDDTALVAQPDETILVSVYDLSGHVLDGSLRMMDSQYVPFIVAPLVGFTYGGAISMHVNGGRRYDLAFVGQAGDTDTGFLLLRKQVESGSSVRIEPTVEDTTQLSIRLFDRFLQPASGYAEITYQDFDVDYVNFESLLRFAVDGEIKIYASPGPVEIRPTLSTDGWLCQFAGTEDTLKVGSSLDLSVGGPLTTRLRVLPPDYLSPWTQIWLDVQDDFGNRVSFFHNPEGRAYIPTVLRSGGSTTYEGDLGECGAWSALLQNGIRKSFDADTKYEITLDMGPFGISRLAGSLFSADTLLRYETLTTEHFAISYPKGYGARYSEISELLEAGYRAMRESTGLDLVSPVTVTISIKADWAGVSIFWGSGDDGLRTAVGAGYPAEQAIRFPLRVPSIAVRVLYHELGNLFVGGTKRGHDDYETLNRGESFASALQTEAEGRVFGANFALYTQGFELRAVFNKIGEGERLSLGAGGIRLIHAYIIKRNTMDVYTKFIDLWSSHTNMKDLLLENGYNADEAMAVLLSCLSNENLAPLFQFAGLQIPAERIDAGYRLIASLIATD